VPAKTSYRRCDKDLLPAASRTFLNRIRRSDRRGGATNVDSECPLESGPDALGRTGDPPRREPRPPSAAGGSPTLGYAAQASPPGSHLLGLAVQALDRLAFRPRPRPAGHRVRWHRQGFKLYWRWKSRRRGDGRPAVSRDVRDLVRRMAAANPLWGAPRIHGELLKLGIEISQAAVAKYMPRRTKPPSSTWRTFLENHIRQIVAVDFFTVPIATFRVLFVFVVLAHDRRRVLHFNVNKHPTATWTAQQIREAFPWDTAPRFLLRDRDGIYGDDLVRVVRSIGIEQVLIAPRSPWQNPYAERVIGSIRRECLDHVVVLNEKHLRHVLGKYFTYYHRSRTHLSLAKDHRSPGRSSRRREAGSSRFPRSADCTTATRDELPENRRRSRRTAWSPPSSCALPRGDAAFDGASSAATSTSRPTSTRRRHLQPGHSLVERPIAGRTGFMVGTGTALQIARARRMADHRQLPLSAEHKHPESVGD